MAHAVGEQGAVGQPGQVVVESLVAKPRLGHQQQLVGVGVRGRDGVGLVAQVGQQAVLVFGELPRAGHGHERIGRRCPADQAGDRVHRRSWPRPLAGQRSARSSASLTPTGAARLRPPGFARPLAARSAGGQPARPRPRAPPSRLRPPPATPRDRARGESLHGVVQPLAFAPERPGVVVRRRDPARALRRHRGKQPHEREREQAAHGVTVTEPSAASRPTGVSAASTALPARAPEHAASGGRRPPGRGDSRRRSRGIAGRRTRGRSRPARPWRRRRPRERPSTIAGPST